MPERNRTEPSVALIALGNRWRGDDGAGPELARRLAAGFPGRCVVIEPKDTAALADALGRAPLAVVLDAACSGAAPGTLHRVAPPAGGLRAGPARNSSHALDLAQAIALANALGRAPQRLAVYALEGERFDAGAGLSPAVERALAGAAQAIACELFDLPEREHAAFPQAARRDIAGSPPAQATAQDGQGLRGAPPFSE